ncbi:MAG: alkaline phosphatase family protein [Candidatus Cloacimonetes bacterium]|nr:alkaline phosphatase family protein [Candidatus Cloacimonadota bacterium]
MKKLHIFMFIDALGWEVLQRHKFLEDLLPHRYRVEMQLGYSCTAIPTILTGVGPEKHGHLSFYYYSPETSPFRLLKPMQYLPPSIFNRWRVRHMISKTIARIKGYTGYFELYSMPFAKLPYFDYIEKKDIFVADGLAPVSNIADEIKKRGIKAHITNWRNSEAENIQALTRDIDKGEINFAFLYTAAMDSLLHRVTKNGAEIQHKLNWYAEKIRTVLHTAHSRYDEVSLAVMSDHGMTTLTQPVDVKSRIEKLPFRYGKDYAAVYDSTIARFWFFKPHVGNTIKHVLEEIKNAHILTEKEKIKYRIYFPDNKFGECFLLMDPGYQIAPSDMGTYALPGMHGFAPEHKDSYAAYCSTEKPDKAPEWVGDFFRLMVGTLDDIVAGN